MSPVRLVPCHWFNRCCFSLLQLSQYFTCILLRWPPVYPVLKNFSSAAWHAFWYVAWCLHRCFNLAPPVHPVPHDSLAPALQIAPVQGHRCIRALPFRPVQPHRFIRCYCILQNSSNSTFLWVLSSCFALLCLFTSSLGSINVHLINSLVSLIVLLLNHQNHKTMA